MYFSKSFGGIIILLVLMSHSPVFGQGNCLIYPEESGERLACELSYRAIQYKQGSNHSQVLFDAAIALGPEYAYAYYQKSVPFFKRGLLNDGFKLISRAIEIAPESYLCYRAYWYFSHRSYVACIADLERYYFDLKGALMPTPGGEMEMRMQLGMAYAKTDQIEKGIKVVLDGINSYDEMGYFIGNFDYHVLGVLYYENEQWTEAVLAFEKQIEIHDYFADSYYYLGLAKKQLLDKKSAEGFFQKSLAKFNGKDGGYSYNVFGDFNVVRSDVEQALEVL